MASSANGTGATDADAVRGRDLRPRLKTQALWEIGFFFYPVVFFRLAPIRDCAVAATFGGANGFGVKPPRLSGDAKVSHSDFSVWQMEMTHRADMEKARYIEGRLHATTHRVVAVGAQSYTKSLLLSSPSLIAAQLPRLKRTCGGESNPNNVRVYVQIRVIKRFKFECARQSASK